jgi:hypothetical protein
MKSNVNYESDFGNILTTRWLSWIRISLCKPTYFATASMLKYAILNSLTVSEVVYT